jgi:predicted short-subunit dehydrogenase-like oxidoreductase (DUF2520 family)
MQKRIVFIGAGNVATHLATAFFKAGWQIVEIFSRALPHANVLSQRCNANATDNFNSITDNADLYIFCLNDQANQSLIPRFKKKNKTLIHTSGSIEVDVFKGISNNFGVLYPLQTFNKDIDLSISDVPFLIEASNNEVFNLLTQLTKSVTAQHYKTTSPQRLQLHIAAIFANNFTNHMFSVAEKILETNNLPLDILLPLIKQTIARLEQGHPLQMQTGPAVRNDINVIEKHIKLLKKDFNEFENLYKTISNSIFELNKLENKNTNDT